MTETPTRDRRRAEDGHAHGATALRLPHSPFAIEWSDDAPAALVVGDSPLIGRSEVALVEVFTAQEQRARTSQAYFRSAVGERLRVIATGQTTDPRHTTTIVHQRDDVSGLEAITELVQPRGIRAVRVQTELRITTSAPVVVTAVSSLNLGFGRSEAELGELVMTVADSEWLAENRWRHIPLREVLPSLSLELHGQDGRGRWGLTSHGAWSTGEHLPVGVIVSTRDDQALGWQIESGTGWHAELSQTRHGGVLSLLGPTDAEHHFASELLPDSGFRSVPAALVSSLDGQEGAIAEMTAYRRWLTGVDTDAELPVIYNDFMNTLMGQPSSERLQPLIDAAAEAGVEVFCIDAGWFADPAPGDWWSTVGEWEEATSRFTGGLAALTDRIREKGMRVGLWLEPEVVGVHSAAAQSLPEETFFHRFGQRVCEHDRYHLDFRHPAATAHMNGVVDRIVAEFDVSFIKLDYNINPGAGTNDDATSAAEGLLGHFRAFRDWVLDIQRRHPGLLVENCSSGAMRADYALLEVTHLQSTSDQQDYLLYPPIAASAPASIAPEQCGNWAYPAAEMSEEETIFTLVTGLSGRLYLSGFLDRLSAAQRSLVAEAIRTHTSLRRGLAGALPFWPLGLPSWEDDAICLGLRTDDGDLLFVWDRHPHERPILIPGAGAEAQQVFPRGPMWQATPTAEGLHLVTKPGPSARVFFVPRSTALAGPPLSPAPQAEEP